MGPPLLEALEKLGAELERSQIPYAVIGGLAAIRHGSTRTTRDVDLLLSVPRVSLPALLDRLQAAGFTMDRDRTIRELTADHLSRIAYRGVPIDLLEPVLPVFAETLRRAGRARIADTDLRLATAEDVIVHKLIAFRDRDREDIRGIHAVQGDKLDLEYVRRQWLTIGDTADDRMAFLAGLATA
jgi:predicted nucleotidyltransferase